MLVEARVEIGEVCLELGKLVLLLGEDSEERANELSDGDGRRGPLLSGNSRRWRLVLHSHKYAGSWRCCQIDLVK